MRVEFDKQGVDVFIQLADVVEEAFPTVAVTEREDAAPREGAFAQYVAMPMSNLVEVPEAVPLEKAALAEPLDAETANDIDGEAVQKDQAQ